MMRNNFSGFVFCLSFLGLVYLVNDKVWLNLFPMEQAHLMGIEWIVLARLFRLRELFFEGKTNDETLARIAREIAESGQPKWLNRKECAALIRVSLPTLDKYIREENLPFRVKNPKAKKRFHYVFDREEVLEWQKSRLSDLHNHRRS